MGNVKTVDYHGFCHQEFLIKEIICKIKHFNQLITKIRTISFKSQSNYSKS